jgi:hypothetical protein
LSRFGVVGVRAGVGEAVAVGRAAAEEASFELGLCLHRRSDADLDPVPLALAHSAVQRHHEVVGVAARVDRAADLGFEGADLDGQLPASLSDPFTKRYGMTSSPANQLSLDRGAIYGP